MSGAKRPDRRHWLAAASHPARRDGAIALAAFLLPWVVALVQVLRHQHLDVGTVTLLASVSLGLPVLWLAWAGYRDARRSTTQVGGLTITQAADQLAVAVGAQWEAEAAVRRLNDPYPLPVSWDPADPSLTDSWDSLVKLATGGAGRPAPPPAGTWAAGPDGLAGTGRDLVEVLAKVPTSRLVVLGEPGAGKTMLMVRLVLDLLARRASGGPVPILASVASWNPAGQDLRSWLTAQLVIDHSALGVAPSADSDEPTLAAALLAAGFILPVLDGLDEIPEEVRGPAISRINDALRPGEHLVVTCRNQQYRDAVRPQGGIEVTLRAAAAVRLRPLDVDAVRGYVCDDAGGPIAKARWEPVLKVLGTAAPAGQALGTPLMVGLARTIYNPRPGELAQALRDPAELCDPVLADRAAVESLLFDALIPASYRHDPPGRWKVQDAEKWLMFLARHLERKIASPDLAWWQLPLAVPRLYPVAGVVAAVGVGVMAGAGIVAVGGARAGAIIGLAVGLAVGLPVGCVAGFGLMVGTGPPKPARGIRWQPPSRLVAGVGAVTSLVVGLTVGLVVGGLVKAGVASGAAAGVAGGAAAGAAVWAVSQTAGPLDLGSAASPSAVLAEDRRTAIVIGALSGFASGLVFGGAAALWTAFPVTAGVRLGAVTWVGVGMTYVGVGFAVAVGISFANAAWPSYWIARAWLALRHQLPWSLMDFLADAHRRGVLRQAGAVYQFRHIELQHRLATRPSEPTSAS